MRPEPAQKSNAARRLSCSRSSRVEPGAPLDAQQVRLGLLGEGEKRSAWRLRTASASPLAASRSSAYSRIVSSMMKRGSPSCSLLPQQALVDQRRESVEHVDAQIAGRAADRLGVVEVQPPANTARRANSRCSGSSSRS